MTTADSLTGLELAVGSPLGLDENVFAALAGLEDETRSTPREALDHALRVALSRPPCLVAFSGGRDSAILLSRAALVARQEGLPLPIPATARFTQAPGSGENDWQELVLERLALDDRLALELDDDLDLVGPRARGLLERYGVRHPPHAPLFELFASQATGGSLVTGFGGDQVLGAWIATRASDVLGPTGRARTLRTFGFRHAPRGLRRRLLQAQVPQRPWLTTDARATYVRRWIEIADSEPADWASHVRWVAAKRSMTVLAHTLALLAAPHDVVVHHPLLTRGVLSALVRAGGRAGLGDRAALTRLLAGDELPAEVVARTTKAHYHHVFFRSSSRAFARAWDGTGVDRTLVDPERLRTAWLGRMPRGASALLLQAAWLGSRERAADQLDGIGEKLDVARPAEHPPG